MLIGKLCIVEVIQQNAVYKMYVASYKHGLFVACHISKFHLIFMLVCYKMVHDHCDCDVICDCLSVCIYMVEVAALHRFEVNIFPSYIIHVFICPFTPKVSNSRQRTMMNGLLHSTVNQLHSLPVTTVYNLSVLYLCG